MSTCPPDKWVQDLVDTHQTLTGQPDIHLPAQPGHLAPGPTHHGRTMPPNTRSDVLKLVSLNLLGSTGPAGEDTDPDDPGTPAAPTADIEATIDWVDPDLIGLQEAGPAKAAITAAYAADWLVTCYATGPAQQNPVLLRRGRWDEVDTEVLQVAPAGDGGVPAARYLSVVTATHRSTGQRVRVLNTCWDALSAPDGVPYDADRQGLYRTHTEAVASQVRRAPESLLLFVTGSTGSDYRNSRARRVAWWPMKALAGEQMVCTWYYRAPSAGTYGAGLLTDQVYSRRTPQVQWASNGVLGGLGSDHGAVRACYRLTRHATATDSKGKPNRGGSNTPNQGQHDHRSAQYNRDANAPVDLDLIGTANLDLYHPGDHAARIDDVTAPPAIAVTCLQELVEHQHQPRWTETQPNKVGGLPAGQSVLRRNDVLRAASGEALDSGWRRASEMDEAGISERFFVWADTNLAVLSGRLRVVSVHMPPKRFSPALHEDYGVTLRDLLHDSPYPWIVGGDWNIALRRDPYDLHGKFGARWFGSGIDGFAVHPSVARHVGGDGGRKFLTAVIPYRVHDDHPVVYLRLARIDTHQADRYPDIGG